MLAVTLAVTVAITRNVAFVSIARQTTLPLLLHGFFNTIVQQNFFKNKNKNKKMQKNCAQKKSREVHVARKKPVPFRIRGSRAV